jgi:hypothetical protein
LYYDLDSSEADMNRLTNAMHLPITDKAKHEIAANQRYVPKIKILFDTLNLAMWMF